MRAIYTEAAQQELESFKAHQTELLEELVAERKLVLGDDVLEITASDIKEASQRIRAYRPTVRRYQSTELVTTVYIGVGVIMMIGAFFYPQIQLILEENRAQAFIFLMGAAMAMVGWVFKYWIVMRKKRFIDETEKYITFEKINRGTLKEEKNDEP